MTAELTATRAITYSTPRRVPLRRLVLSSPITGTLIGTVVVVLLWWLASAVNPVIADPGSALRQVADTTASGLLPPHMWWTLSNAFQGFALAVVIGIPLGILFGTRPFAREVFGDVVYSFSSVPKLVIFPVLLVIFGLGRLSETLFVMLSAIFLIIIQVMVACTDIQPIHRRVGRVFRTPQHRVLLNILLPSIAAGMVAGLRLGFSMGLVHAILAEMAIGNNGIGFLIWSAYRNLDMALLFGLIFLLSLIAIVINLALFYVEKKLRGGLTLVA